jgi:peptidoglycan biosynthesis protein MviN/MurJ (putative lipid II flippase)
MNITFPAGTFIALFVFAPGHLRIFSVFALPALTSVNVKIMLIILP